MRPTRSNMGNLAALIVLAATAAACSVDGTSSASAGSRTTVSISQGSLPAIAASAVGFSADFGYGPPGPIDPAHVDSLIVTVDSVQVLPDSLLAHRHAGEPWGPPDSDGRMQRLGDGPLGPSAPSYHFGRYFPFGPGGIRDSLRMRDSTMLRDSLGWGMLAEDWYTLQLSGSGHLDLMHLPTDTANALMLAVGTVPPGEYGAARLFVSDAKIYFDTTITSRDSAVTFLPDTGYTVTIPSAARSGIKTRAGFTIPDGASDVVLLFDVATSVRHAVALRDGTILIVPVLGGFCHRHYD
jgi:hypothetical protein